MPAVTPNRLYPYPVAADPTDVPGDLERLALAIEDDVQFQYDRIVPRSMAKAWRTSSGSLFTNFTSGAAVFLGLDDGFQVNVNADFEIVGTRLYPRAEGFYLVWGSLSWPVVSTVSPYPQGRHVEVWANGITRLGRDGFNNDIPAADGSAETVAFGGRDMNGTTDYFSVSVRAFSDTGAAIPTLRLNTRSITAVRMNTT